MKPPKPCALASVSGRQKFWMCSLIWLINPWSWRITVLLRRDFVYWRPFVNIAAQKLTDQGDEEECKDSHLTYFVHWAEEMAPTLEWQNNLKQLEDYENEHDNLRAALEWSSSHENKAKEGLQLATACGSFWRLHSHVSEGRRRFSIALSPKLVQDRSSLHARALNYAATLAYLQGDYPAAQPMIEEVIDDMA